MKRFLFMLKAAETFREKYENNEVEDLEIMVTLLFFLYKGYIRTSREFSFMLRWIFEDDITILKVLYKVQKYGDILMKDLKEVSHPL